VKFEQFLSTWQGVQAENKFSRFAIVGLLLAVLMLVTLAFRKETIVTIAPFTLTEDAWVTKDQASQNYQEAWAFAFAQMLGNVTPGTVGFIKDRIQPLLSPRIYQDVIDVLEVQSQDIVNNRVTMRFEPRSVMYEVSTGKVFVEGWSYVKAISTNETRSARTYEFKIKVSNYAPVFEHIETYAGKPKTVDELKKQRSKS